ncbi:MAG: penicillin acylase family protein [Acidobacteriota bacterium]
MTAPPAVHPFGVRARLRAAARILGVAALSAAFAIAIPIHADGPSSTMPSTALDGPAAWAAAATPLSTASTASYEFLPASDGPVPRGGFRLPEQTVDGLEQPARVRRDGFGTPHIFALNDADALFMLGWVHAEDRLFQMDVLRRTFSGTLAELLGNAVIEQDVQFRTFGLRRAAEASLLAIDSEAQRWLEPYVAGVNAYIAAGRPLPAEYAALELSAVEPWTAIDSLVISKGIAFSLSFGAEDITRTEALLTFEAAGAALGFDGRALFVEDLYRVAPFDPAVTDPDGAPALPVPSLDASVVRAGNASPLPAYLAGANAQRLVRGWREQLEAAPATASLLQLAGRDRGSNWWIAGPEATVEGAAILANDPHLGLDAPATFYEAHMRVPTTPEREAMNVLGVSFPGTPGIIQGCNPWLCWGSTTHRMDVTDVYLEELVIDPTTGAPTHTRFRGELEPILPLLQVYRANQPGNGTLDDLVTVPVPAEAGGVVLIVPRRNNGPIVQIDASDPTSVTGLSVQYAGWGPTQDVAALVRWARARSFDAFLDGLAFLDFGSQNWGVIDIFGNIGWFTSGELPLREDLQTLMTADGGMPPTFIRDGTGALRHEWLALDGAPADPAQALPYAVLPFAEMPQRVNPESGVLLNANNDPIGVNNDNDPFNQLRPGGGLYYLGTDYSPGYRLGRLEAAIDDLRDAGPLSADIFAELQGDSVLRDAQALVPYLIAAFDNAQESALPSLMAFASDGEIAEAITRLRIWDFGTPTGIAVGYDPGDDITEWDDDGIGPEPTIAEMNDSVAATLYAVWRGQILRGVVDGALERLDDASGGLFGLAGFTPAGDLALVALRNVLDRFDAQEGLGASGVPFIVVPGRDVPASGGGPVATAAEARDEALLSALRAALDRLAGPDFADAFGGSTDQNDYAWGLLHRITFDHPLGGPFNLPPAGGLADVGPNLPGLARSGGFQTLDASSHDPRAEDAQSFQFGAGPARRFVGVQQIDGRDLREVIPGGTSEALGSRFQADQLRLWLVNDLHDLPLTPDEVLAVAFVFQRFVPPPSGG